MAALIVLVTHQGTLRIVEFLGIPTLHLARLDHLILVPLTFVGLKAVTRSHITPFGVLFLTGVTLLALGFAGNLRTGWMGLSTLIAAWLTTRFWFTSAAVGFIEYKRADGAQETYRYLRNVGIAVAAIGFSAYIPGPVGELLTGSAGRLQARGGLTAMTSVFEHPAPFTFFMVAMFSVALAASVHWNSRTELFWAGIFAIAGILGLRLRTLALLALAAGTVLLMLKGGMAARLRRLGIVFSAALFAIAIMSESPGALRRLDSYVGEGFQQPAPRVVLYRTAFQIAGDEAPLGLGFGRFGSHIARLNYSDAYEKYGISDRWGLSRANPTFTNDGTWHSILGELGFVGLAVAGVSILVILLVLIAGHRRLPTVHTGMYSAATAAVFIVLVVDSLFTPRVFDSIVSVLHGILFGAAFAEVGRARTVSGN